MAPETTDGSEAVFAFVRSVPAGRVVTYGQVAGCVVGLSLTAREVGGIMRFTPKDVPWQRVVGAGGRLPIVKRSPELRDLQRRLLIQEGVVFRAADPYCVDMSKSQWFTEPSDSAQRNLFDETHPMEETHPIEE
jgi:methylated-DNA-protein-cysteine methyltransferase-like protein